MRVSKLSFAAILLALCIFGARNAQASPVDWNCNDGGFLVGFVGNVGAWLDHAYPVCAPYNTLTQQLGATYTGPEFGTSGGGSPRSALCPPGEVVAGMAYGAAHPYEPPQSYLQNLVLTCAPLSDPSQRDPNKPGLISDGGPQEYSGDCNYWGPDYVAAGAGYTPNLYLGGMGLTCRRVSDVIEEADAIRRGVDERQRARYLAEHPRVNISPGEVRKFAIITADAAAADKAHWKQAGSEIGKLSKDAIDGVWNTSLGQVTFQQTGTSLAGTYKGGALYLVNGSGTFTGEWVQNTSKQTCATQEKGSSYWGNVTFKFNLTKNHFDGHWSYCDGKQDNIWTGDRAP